MLGVCVGTCRRRFVALYNVWKETHVLTTVTMIEVVVEVVEVVVELVRVGGGCSCSGRLDVQYVLGTGAGGGQREREGWACVCVCVFGCVYVCVWAVCVSE